MHKYIDFSAKTTYNKQNVINNIKTNTLKKRVHLWNFYREFPMAFGQAERERMEVDGRWLWSGSAELDL